MPEEKPKETEPEKEAPKEVKTLLVWESPLRTFKRRDYRYFQTVGLILLLIAVIAIFIQEFLLIGVLLALFFVLYVLGTVEPEKVEHRITTQGVTTAGKSYVWNELSDFWFSDKLGSLVLNIDTKVRFPSRLLILVPYLERDKVKETLIKYLPFKEEVPTSWMDNTVEWFTSKLPQSLR